MNRSIVMTVFDPPGPCPCPCPEPDDDEEEVGDDDDDEEEDAVSERILLVLLSESCPVSPPVPPPVSPPVCEEAIRKNSLLINSRECGVVTSIPV